VLGDEVGDGDEVGMTEPRRREGLATGAFEIVGRVRRAGAESVQPLDRDLFGVEPQIGREPDLGHPAGAEWPL
jgi:hypothetical protein